MSRGRLSAQASQLLRKIKEDPMSYLTDEEKDLIELLFKLTKLLPATLEKD